MARYYGGVTTLLSLLVVTLIPTTIGTDMDLGRLTEFKDFTDNPGDSVRWTVSAFGPCSLACGGGIQVRKMRCIMTYDGTLEIKVPEYACPLPVPNLTRPCNSQPCSGRWTISKWSECSVTCGVGEQTRQVSCQATPQASGGQQLAKPECGGLAPEGYRRCRIVDCPFSNKVEPHSILSENYTLLQLHKAKKIKVNVGGQVYLLPGQTVVVKCPVKHFSKKLVHWSRGYRLVPFMGRVRSTTGGLHITKGDPKTDAGTYTCLAGDLSATVTIGFLEKNDSSTKMYKKWFQSHKRHKKIPGKYKSGIAAHNNIVSDQQRDQSHNFSQSLAFVSNDWSTCSANFGVRGHKKRKVTCSHVTAKYVKIVSDDECQRAGLVKPETTKECLSDKKYATWRTGPWSECLPDCGKTGNASRRLTCVWGSTDEPAGRACDSSSKPPASMQCTPKTCASECSDSSRYCSLSRLLKLCRFHYFEQQCCLTCQALKNSQS